MITRTRLRNFKCFRDEDVDFRPLTFISGLNSSGKSTLLHALLLLRQSYLNGQLGAGAFELNGRLVQLGTAQDVLFEDAEDESLSIAVTFSNDEHGAFETGYRRETDVLELQRSEVSENVFSQSLFTDSFHYLKAERVGPRTSFPMSDYEVRHHRQIGPAGEFTWHFLDLFGSEAVRHDLLLHPNCESKQLDRQAEAWLSAVSPGVRISVTRHNAMDLMSFSVGFRSGPGQVASRAYRPTNVGFGITYALPVIVALLSAPADGLVIIENPEAHLHPLGQVAMGQLASIAAATGTQVIIESHSDHVLNGVRLAVHDGRIKPNAVELKYAEWTGDKGPPRLSSLHIDREGRIDRWPPGFFDEFERALDRLLEPIGS